MADDTLSAILADIKNNSGKFYVYVLSYPDETPFYVGCGRAGVRHPRILDHEKLAVGSSRYRQSLKSGIIRKIIRQGGSVLKSIDSWHLTLDAMFERETELITSFGRRDLGNGTLANGNDGGTGQINPTPETRAKLSAGLAAWWTDERRAEAAGKARINFGTDAALAKLRAACASPEWRARRSLLTKAALADPEKGKRIRDAANIVFRSPEYRAARSKFAKGMFESKAARDHASKKQKEVWTDPEYREKSLIRLKEMTLKRWSLPGTRERAGAKTRAIWANSEKKETWRANQRASWTPERRAANAERMKKMRAAQEEAKRAARDV